MKTFLSQLSGFEPIIRVLTLAGASPEQIAQAIKPVIQAKLDRIARQKGLSQSWPLELNGSYKGDHHLN